VEITVCCFQEVENQLFEAEAVASLRKPPLPPVQAIMAAGGLLTGD